MPNTANVSFWFDSLDGEALVIALDLKGLAVSSGAACSSGANEPSHVLRGDGSLRGPGTQQPALQPAPADDARKRLTGRSSWSRRRWPECGSFRVTDDHSLASCRGPRS